MATNANRICCNRIRRFCLLLIFAVFFFLLAMERLFRHDTMLAAGRPEKPGEHAKNAVVGRGFVRVGVVFSWG